MPRISKLYKEKVVPQLPEGISITERPLGLEFLQRGNERWMKVIQALDALDSTQCLQIAMDGLTKGNINSIKASIKHAGDKLGHTGKIRFAVQGNLLLIWSNK